MFHHPKKRLAVNYRWYRLAFGGVVAVALTVGALIGCEFLFSVWVALRPAQVSIQTLQVQIKTEGNRSRRRVGASWMESSHQLWMMSLTGDGDTIGYHHGLLTAPMTQRFDHHMSDLFESVVSSTIKRWMLTRLVQLKFRNLPTHVSETRWREMSAFASAIHDDRDYPVEVFPRVVYYHTLYDITRDIADSPLLGCSTAASWGTASKNGNLIIGRNFDFEAGELFDREKAVLRFAQQGKLKFVSVAWPGMMGAVTGVNEKRIYVSLNAARTDDETAEGTPAVFLLREILEEASTLEQAIDIAKRFRVIVPFAVMIADGKRAERPVVVAELSSHQKAFRWPLFSQTHASTMSLANHFLSPEFQHDQNNLRVRDGTSSGARYRRLEQLLTRYRRTFDVQTMATVMRDRSDEHDRRLAQGDRNAIDAQIATHGVIVDLTRFVLWVSRGPHLDGNYLPIDLTSAFFNDTFEVSSSISTIP